MSRTAGGLGWYSLDPFDATRGVCPDPSTMRTIPLCLFAALCSTLAAQPNVVPGLDGRLTQITSMTYYGRRGASHPNGEIGMAFANTMCNPGSVNIPWFQAMQPDHPMFGFLVVRVAGGKIEQINEWSFCKHAFLSINVNGDCGTCQNPGTGSLMGLNCSDTYGAGNNASRTWLGPPNEIDPWLGTWEPVGSYFDIGDPMQAGYPAPADGVRSLSQSIFDSVDNRVTVDEIDLTTPNADYYYGIQIMFEGEAIGNRGDNNAHRGMVPTWTGSQWSFANTGPDQAYGSILERWPGANIEFGQNGMDDGRIFVASKVTSLGGGNYHYEYAVHNIDNSRAGASLRIPIDGNATATNFTFGDIDDDAGNDWSVARVGNEIVFSAPAGNSLEWNTIYNFGFDCDLAPGNGACQIDEARPGPGDPWIEVETEAPVVNASVAFFGGGCAGSSAPTAPCAEQNSTGGALSQELDSGEFCYAVFQTGSSQVESFDIWTASTGGSVIVPAHIYAEVNGRPADTPIASTTVTVGSTEGFYTATFSPPVSLNGTFFLGVDSSAQTNYVSSLTAGSLSIAYRRASAAALWGVTARRSAWRVNCAAVPGIAPVGLPTPGANYDLTLDTALASSAAVLVSGLSDSTYLGTPLPAILPGAPGCELLVAPEALDAVLTSATGTASAPIVVPNDPGLSGLRVFHQWAVLDPAANALGIVVSSGVRAVVGN